MEGNPINTATGNKYQVETDYLGTGPFPLKFRRHYNSLVGITTDGPFGFKWHGSYERKVAPVDQFEPLSTTTDVKVYRDDGRGYGFQLVDQDWVSDADVSDTLVELKDGSGNRIGWQYTVFSNDSVEAYDIDGRLTSITNRAGHTQTLTYDTDGQLITVTDPFARTLTFTYDNDGYIATMTDPAGKVYTYDYGANKDLVSVTYPDDTPADATDNPQRLYHYEDTVFRNALTGITDENGNRFATWAYDDQGRAIVSEHAGGAERVDLVYNSDGTTTATDTQGRVQTYHFDIVHDVYKVDQIDGAPCQSCGGQTQSSAYDANGNIASRTDFNGNITNYTYDLDRNLETSRTEAVGTAAQRTTTTVWHADLRLPVQIDVFDNTGTHRKRASLTYDSVGRLLIRTGTDMTSGTSRTATNTYNTLGLIASSDGPRNDISDMTTYGYDAQGNLITTTNALGQVTQVTQHDAHGRPLTLQAPNNLVTQLAYDARGRLNSRTVDGQVTLFAYDGAGNLTGITLPTGVALNYTYDSAQRQTGITDNFGNSITYTLDAMGNRIKEDVTDPTGVLTRTQSRVYNALSRLVQAVGGAGQQTDYGYDANGNRVSVTDGRDNQTISAFDALNRLVATTDALNGVTSYDYDALDNLTKVIDPTGLETGYTYNALGDLLQLQSPDTGTTTYTYDNAGNRLSQMDAKGVQVFYAYDARNRLTLIDYADDALDVTFTHDEGNNGIGRLTTLTDASGGTGYTYDLRGNLISVETTRDGITHTTGYAYNGAGQVIQMTYPSGRTVDYPRNALGQVGSVATTFNGNTQTLASGITYAPFGPLSGLTFGNSVPLTRTLDLDYRLTAQTQGTVLDQGFTHDPGDNITGIIDNLGATSDQGFAYDALDRLTQANGSYGDLGYDYDAVGNRLLKDTDGSAATYGYAAGSHHLEAIAGQTAQGFVYDANGNTVDNDTFEFTYGDNNRLTEVSNNLIPIATYTHNGRGERVKKDTGEITYYHYDTAGQLIAETDAAGATLREYIYLDGLPLALVTAGATGSASQTLFSDTFEGADGRIIDDQADGLWSGRAPASQTSAEVQSGQARILASQRISSGPRFTLASEESLVTSLQLFSSGQTLLKRLGAPSTGIEVRFLRELNRATAHIGDLRDASLETTFTLPQGTASLQVTISLDENGLVRVTLTDDLGNVYDTGLVSSSLLGQGDYRLELSTIRIGGQHVEMLVDDVLVTQGLNIATEPAGTYFIYADHLGTPQVLTDDTQDTVWRAEYTPFGEASITTEIVTNNLRFPGQYYDAETGLHYNYFRDYDPGIGRYVQSDPIGLAGGINTYAYVGNNPLFYIDPLGLTAECPFSPPTSDPNWETETGSKTFHCGYRIFREKREPCPKDPRAECVYDDDDNLVTVWHKDSQCQGTPDSYPPYDPRHIWPDSGGPLKNTDAFFRSFDRFFGIR